MNNYRPNEGNYIKKIRRKSETKSMVVVHWNLRSKEYDKSWWGNIISGLYNALVLFVGVDWLWNPHKVEYYKTYVKASHNTASLRVSGEETFVSLKPEC